MPQLKFVSGYKFLQNDKGYLIRTALICLAIMQRLQVCAGKDGRKKVKQSPVSCLSLGNYRTDGHISEFIGMHIGVSPQNRCQRHRLEPGIVHFLHCLGIVFFFA